MFDLSHDVKLSCNMGDLVPILVMDCVPGDKINISAEAMIRLAPMIAPVMHKMDVTMHFFFVPNRIIWPNWEKYITNTKLEDTNLLPAFPVIQVKGDGENYTLLHDYLGIPNPSTIPDAGEAETVSALPFYAYNKIYSEYYRDQNLIPENAIALTATDGLNTVNFDILKRAWEHDYFTSCLPFAQKGDSVEIPLGDVVLKDDWNIQGLKPFFAQNSAIDWAIGNIQNVGATVPDREINIQGQTAPAAYNPMGTLTTQATTINDLRRAFRLQEWLEKNARGGTRYNESILMHFGIKTSDARLQRPEYITGLKAPIQISEVLNTTGTENAPQGDMSGHGIAYVTGNNSSYFCEEHGYIIGIMNIQPIPAYFQGLDRHWLKTTDPTEFFWPSFAHLGEQEIYNSELYAYRAQGRETFGYLPRYAEYKFMSNRVAGDFRTTLKFWHMAREFETMPQLNEEFVTANPTKRIFAVEDPEAQPLWCHVYNYIKAVRKMPKFGTPSF
jgi:hypothetical protein